MGSIFKLADVKGITLPEAMLVAHHISEDKLNVFDAFHAVLSHGQPIITSDKRNAALGLPVILLKGSERLRAANRVSTWVGHLYIW